MNSRYNKFLLLACIFLSYAVASCKKGDKGLQPLESGNYAYDKMGYYSSVRMFTKDGEVKDQNLIEEYKIKYSIYIDPVNSGSQDTFRIVDANNAQYIWKNSTSNQVMTKDFTVTKMDDHYEFRSKDTSFLYTQQVDNPLSYIGKYKPYYFVIPAPIGYNIVKTFQYYYAAPSARSLTFPFINVIRFATLSYQGQPYSSYYNVNKVNNVFDDKFPYNTLRADTLLVQTFNVTYTRL